MQAVFLVDESERKSAEALEAPELLINVNMVHTLLLDSPKHYEGYEQWLAYYGMTCANVLQRPIDLLNYRPDNTFKPRWHKRFIKAHRGYLVLLGWIRYFNERGATAATLHPMGLMSPMEHIRAAQSPRELLGRFQSLDEGLTMPEARRAYAHFDELPSAYQLC